MAHALFATSAVCLAMHAACVNHQAVFTYAFSHFVGNGTGTPFSLKNTA